MGHETCLTPIADLKRLCALSVLCGEKYLSIDTETLKRNDLVWWIARKRTI